MRLLIMISNNLFGIITYEIDFICNLNLIYNLVFEIKY